MSHDHDMERALRRLAEDAAHQGAGQAQRGIAAAVTTATHAATDALHAHAGRRDAHVTPGYYLAKTSSPNQRVHWRDLEGRPPLGGIDPTLLELAADQLVSDTVPDERLPIAAIGEVSPKLVRANDPRLSGASLVRRSSESLAAGDWIGLHEVAGEQRARRATPTTPGGAAGFVAESAGVNEVVNIFVNGENQWGTVTGATAADIGRTVFLTTHGKASLTPPAQVGETIQPMGVIVGFNGLRTCVLVRFEFRFRLRE
ncbi:MAG: hypothetical protein EI684_05090 [Candidatus Viridilinea halotolerans]|uniref:Uncharacterized protein n=1 Tax=Candidatus Viridilinea halotolerans TaxID=2491704 RepID=A0A426U5U4_9CHLR|nr:MAG: hypothetical protein EI684_05090 [Candidatus Viridilinea halotolerans]